MEISHDNPLSAEELEEIFEGETHADDVSAMILSGEVSFGDPDIQIAEGEL